MCPSAGHELIRASGVQPDSLTYARDEASGQLHVPAALLPAKEHPLPTTNETVRVFRRRELCLDPDMTFTLIRPGRSSIAKPTDLSPVPEEI